MAHLHAQEKLHYQAAKAQRDEGEDDTATALHEAHEEIGLEPSHVKIIRVLEPFLSKHLLRVTPVIGMLQEHHKFEPKPNAGEVDTIFDVPLEMFLKDERHRAKDLEWKTAQFRVHYFEYDAPDGRRCTMWGLTASIILNRKPDFPEFCETCKSFKQANTKKDI